VHYLTLVTVSHCDTTQSKESKSSIYKGGGRRRTKKKMKHWPEQFTMCNTQLACALLRAPAAKVGRWKPIMCGQGPLPLHLHRMAAHGAHLPPVQPLIAAL
jgi:hypothetical protein